MSTRADPSRIAQALPLIAAAAYASIVIGARGLASLAQVGELALGYTVTIIAATVFAGVVLLLWRVLAAARRGDQPHAGKIARAWLADRLSTDRGRSLWLPAATFILVMTGFSLFKQTVLPTAGFISGPAIAAADRALFGVDPWRITHALMPSAWATQAIDLAYHAWFAPMTLGVALCAFARPGSVLAMRYLLGYCLLWILQGSLLAYWLPAAGPAYFVNFQVESGRFAELMQRLAEQDAALRAAGAPGLTALTIQNYLLQLFGSKAVVLGGGISAMPSLHNAMAVLFACAARHLSLPLGRGFTVYAIVIWIGSVHLGWHYALDGIVALAATLVIWKATGMMCHVGRRSMAELGETVAAEA